MAIDKALTPAAIAVIDPEIEVEIEIEIGEPDDLPPEEETAEDFDANLAEYMDESVLQELASDLIADFDKDITDRSDWAETYVEGLKLLGLKYEERTEPWIDACGVFHPMLTESVVRFQSESIMETFPAAGPVKTQIIGKDDPKTQEAALRVRDDMNYQLTSEMQEYRPEHEKLLWNLPIAGSAFKKVYYDPSKGRQVAMFIPAEDIVVPYGASSIESADRVTHVMRKTTNEMTLLQQRGFYRDIELGEPSGELDDIEKKKATESGMTATNDSRYRLLEMHVHLDLEGFEDLDEKGKPTGVALPYVVTIDKSSGEILAIRRNWYEADSLHIKRQHFVHYQYIPGFGFYGYGLIHLIGGYAKSATMIIRQLVDAGTLSNLPGGLKSRGMRIKGDDTPISPGEFRDVDVSSGSIRDNILPLPYKEPSQVLFALFQNIVQEGRAFASAGDLKISDMSGSAPVGTTLALLERTLKVMSAVQARLHYAMRQEFKLLKVIIRDYTPDEYTYEPVEGSRMAKQSDYDMTEVLPVSDPNAATMAQKVVQYQAVIQLAQQAPQLYDLPLLHRQMIEVLGVKNASKLVPLEDDLKPVDPVQENQNILMGKPVKAFIQQNHEAHIAVHMAAMQDPKIMKIVGQSPMAQQIQASLLAHVNEHVAFEYRRQVETELGLPMPTKEENENMDEATASQVAQFAAKASLRLLQRDQAEAATEQAQQQQQDPVIQMQQQELQIKQQELKMREKKVLIDASEAADRLELERERIASQERIAGAQIGARIQSDKEKLRAKEQVDGARIGVDVAKTKDQMAMQTRNKE